MRMNIILIVVSLVFFSKCKITHGESEIARKDVKEIKVEELTGDFLKIDSIFNSITTVKLETNENNLIKHCQKVLLSNDRIYILNGKSNLFVFSLDGKFIQEISRKGRGPGEFFELRDFQVDKNDNIYLLDYGKILMFSKGGNLLDSFSFRKFCAKSHCNPLEFALTDKFGEFYLWGGSFGIKSNRNKDCYALYKIDKSSDIIERHFPLKYLIVGNCNRFRSFDDLINVEPVFGNDTIYAIRDNKFEARYAINCGDRSLKEKVPENLSTLSKFKSKVSENYFIDFRNFIETKGWCHFKFSFKKQVYNAYYCKSRNKTFVSKSYPRVPNRFTPHFMHTNYGDKMVAIANAYQIVKEIERLMENKSELSDDELRLISTLSDIKTTDNPVLLICEMKEVS